jgi:hypothetical protein
VDNLETTLAVTAQILAGAGLAAAAGLRAFLPPLVVGLLGRYDLLDLREGLAWMESTPALVVFGTAVLLEVLADKVPWLDHALDAVGSVLKPMAAILVVAASLVDLPPLWAAVVAIVVGGTVSVTVHLGKAGLRLASTALTGGAANPAISAVEDGLSLGGALLAIFFPLLAFVLLLAGGALVARALRRRRRSRLAHGAVHP